jgi:2-polyprenyl-3-methyl-5-hydroxy-6-metoxy-1,4-benzoquinol methylase
VLCFSRSRHLRRAVAPLPRRPAENPTTTTLASPIRTLARPAAGAGRALVHVPCNHCGRDVTHGVHNVSRLVRCVHCGLVFVSPRPTAEALAERYERDYFHCAEPTFGGYEDYEADRAEITRTFARRMRQLAPFVATARPRLLDVGCATGIFLEVARSAGWSGEGLDISAYALDRARAKGFAVRRGTLEEVDVADGSFDVLTMWDFIEHVPDPAATLARAHRLLRPGGTLALSTPDAGSLLARLLGPRWLGFRSIDEHLYFFSRRTLAAMLEGAGFEVRATHAVGKYLTLPRLIERLRFYTRTGAVLLRAVDRVVPRLSLYVTSFDTMTVIATRRPD